MGWTVESRIVAGFGIALGLVALMALVAILALTASSRRYHEATRLQAASREALEGLAEFEAANTEFLRYLVSPDPRWLERRGAAVDSTRAALERLSGTEATRGLLEEWSQASLSSIAARQGAGLDEAVRIRDQRALPAALSLRQ